jgi:anti-anti-sigma regulatory factor
VPTEWAKSLMVSEWPSAGSRILIAKGLLDSTTYRVLRDEVIKAALDDPPAVIVDVTELAVPADSAWAVFTSAYWHVSQWKDVPILLVCAHRAGREVIVRNGITRYVHVYPSIDDAMEALSKSDVRPPRRRARAELPAFTASAARSRQLVTEWLTAWAKPEFIPVAKMIVTVFVENVLAHTEGAPAVRAETDGCTVTVAVHDSSTMLAGRREESSVDRVSGLAIVAAMSRKWGNSPTSTGKTVWAVLGPENCI